MKDLIAIKHLASQAMDITGLMPTSDVRYSMTARGRQAIIDVTMVDGSVCESGKVAEIKFPMLFAHNSNGVLPDGILELQRLAAEPVCFFEVQASNKSPGSRW